MQVSQPTPRIICNIYQAELRKQEAESGWATVN